MLHITNGHSVSIPLTGIPGEVSYWVDILHEGPVPAGLTLGQLSALRAQFLTDMGWDADDTRSYFAARDAQLAGWARHEEVVLWFEHDLYDQLQLVQILDWFAARDLGKTKLRLICIGEFPGITRFGGLGELRPDQLVTLFPSRRDVSAAELKVAQNAWRAFCSPDPSRIEELLGGDTSALPYLKARWSGIWSSFLRPGTACPGPNGRSSKSFPEEAVPSQRFSSRTWTARTESSPEMV